MDGERRHFLDEPFILERTMFVRAADLLRPYARQETSALPERLRTALARCIVQLLAIHHELTRAPDAVTAERGAEAVGPATPLPAAPRPAPRQVQRNGRRTRRGKGDAS